LRSYSPGGALNALATALPGSIPTTPSAHCLRLGLTGYLIPVAPLAFAPERQEQASKSPSPWTFEAACARFTPSKSGQRSQPTYYRGCWHVVSRCLFLEYRRVSSSRKAVYDPKAFIPHAAWLCQGFPHCTKFLTAASRRSLGRVSVPVWLVILSDQLPIAALVGHYPTN